MMKVKYNGQEFEAGLNEKGHYVVGGTLVSLDGVNFTKGFEKVIEYTKEQILTMSVAELDAVEAEIGNIDGYYAMLKADKQTAILEAFGL